MFFLWRLGDGFVVEVNVIVGIRGGLLFFDLNAVFEVVVFWVGMIVDQMILSSCSVTEF